jgi:hypothetical protein
MVTNSAGHKPTNFIIVRENFPNPLLFKKQNNIYVNLFYSCSCTFGTPLVYTYFPGLFTRNFVDKVAHLRAVKQEGFADGSVNGTLQSPATAGGVYPLFYKLQSDVR